MMIVTAVLGIGFIFAIAGDFVLWAKLEEQRKATAEEYNRRWDEISRALSIEKEKNKEIETLNEWNGTFEKRGDFWYDTSEKLVHERDALQDKLCALLCPMNDHVWKDGRCVKCGRVKDANN